MMLRGAVLLQRSARTVMARCHWSNPSLVVVQKLWNPQQQQQKHQRRRGCSSSSSPRKAPDPDEDESSDLWEARLTKALQQLDECTVGAETTWTASSLLEEVRDCYVSLGRLDDATAMEMKLLELAREDQREQADCYHRLGSLQLQMQHFADARRYYQLALALFYEIHGKDSFHREMGKLLVGLGGICVHQGDPERALPLLAQAEEHYRQHGKRVTDPVIMDSSITPDDDDIDAIDDDGPHPEISVVLGNQALIHRMMGQHQVAIEKYKEMLVFLDRYESHNEEKKHEVQLQIADCLFAVNQLGPALDHFQILLDNLKSRRDDEETAQEGVLRHHIGVIHSKQGRMEDALRELESAYVIHKRVLGEMDPHVASTLNALGAVHASLGNDGEALSYFRESLMIARIHAGSEGDKDPQVMQTLRNISLVHGNKVPKWN